MRFGVSRAPTANCTSGQAPILRRMSILAPSRFAVALSRAFHEFIASLLSRFSCRRGRSRRASSAEIPRWHPERLATYRRRPRLK